MATITKSAARGQQASATSNGKVASNGKVNGSAAAASSGGMVGSAAITASAAPDRSEINAAIFAALAYVSGKEGDRDSLTDGAAYAVDLTIAGTIDGQRVAERIDGRLTVGHSSEKASSATPNVAHIIAAILGKLNKATRAKVLAELPADYAAGGQSLPGLSVGDVAEAENLLGLLRQTKRIVARGPVKCEYERESVEHELIEGGGRPEAVQPIDDDGRPAASGGVAAGLALFAVDCE